MLRGYCKYLQQVGIAFSQSYMEETLNRYPAIANLLVELFNAKFDPERETRSGDAFAAHEAELLREMKALVPEATLHRHPAFIDEVVAAIKQPRQKQIDTFWNAIKFLLDGVASLDDERILKSYMDVIHATLRTSYFQRPGGEARHYISFKFDSSRVPDAPKPVPYREIFVYGPRVEGIHLRFGAVARGGLRWSDRREDFRTEVLGLVKAQMVKNTVIVPVGSKGGFFVKQPPASGERDDSAGRGRGLLPHVHRGPARHHRQPGRRRGRAAAGRGPPRRRRSLPGGRRRQGHGDLLRHRQRHRRRARLLAGRRLRLGRLQRLRPQGHGHHRQGRVGIGQAPFPRHWVATARPRISPAWASATCPATCSATACCCRATSA